MRPVTYAMGISLDGFIVGPDGGFDWGTPDDEVFRFWIDEISRGRRPPDGTAAVRDDAVLGDRRPGSIARRRGARVDRTVETASEGGVLHHAVGGGGQCPPGLRRPGRGDRAAAGRAGRGRHRDRRRDAGGRGGRAGPDRRVPGRWSTRCWSAVASRSSHSASAGWISSSSRPAPSVRRSSTSATAWRADPGHADPPLRAPTVLAPQCAAGTEPGRPAGVQGSMTVRRYRTTPVGPSATIVAELTSVPGQPSTRSRRSTSVARA